MSYILVIVESPAKCSKIESFLGEGYKCAASFGHIRELDGLNSINIEDNFKPTFKECDDKKQQIIKLRKLINDASEVLLASDDDREGEAISWHICEVFKLPVKTTKRIVFHEITERALKQAVKDARTININLVNAQISRQVLDVLVGYKLSPILWKYISKNTKNGLSAGRCQTPALRLVYDNYKEIKASPGRKVYNTTGYFTSHNLPFVLTHNHDGEENMSNFLENSVNYEHIYSYGELRDTTKQPPMPFTTSTLQQAASNEMRISPKETMKLCQKLYEGGYITYMRTDSTTYSEEFIEKSTKYISSEYGREYVHSDIKRLSIRKVDGDDNILTDNAISKGKGKGTDGKGKGTGKAKTIKKNEEEKVHAQEAHEAIRPTDITVKDKYMNDKELGTKEIKMYQLIRRNTLESCMSPATYKAFTAKITAPEEHEYKYSIEQAVFKGWKVVDGVEDNNKEFNYLQTLKNSSILNYKKISSKVSMKDLKTHYTEAKLVQLLEEKGIGRPSTFSSLIDKIQERGYVKVENVKGVTISCIDYELEEEELSKIIVDREFGNEKNKLVIQPTGILVLEFLLKHFDLLFQYDYTKHMEDTLDQISKGNKIWHDLCKECLDEIVRLSTIIVDNNKKIKRKNNQLEHTSTSGNNDDNDINDNNEDNDDNHNNDNDNDNDEKSSNKLEIKVDDNHVYMIAKYGPVLKCTIGDKITFKPVREDINIDKLKKGEYRLDELVVENKQSGHLLGIFDKKEVYLKNGKFGYYIEYGEVKKAIRIGLKKPTEVTLDDVSELLFDATSEKIFSRNLDDNLSIRNGKFGDYIFYKTKTMKKPKFFKLNGFKEDYKTCEISILIKWINDTYKIYQCI
jgi:DNA topoisomerase-1